MINFEPLQIKYIYVKKAYKIGICSGLNVNPLLPLASPIRNNSVNRCSNAWEVPDNLISLRRDHTYTHIDLAIRHRVIISDSRVYQNKSWNTMEKVRFILDKLDGAIRVTG